MTCKTPAVITAIIFYDDTIGPMQLDPCNYLVIRICTKTIAKSFFYICDPLFLLSRLPDFLAKNIFLYFRLD